MKVVIMAGGKGTRISSFIRDIPKPMIPIANKPVLEHELESLREQGFNDVIITVGHLGHIIMDYFGDGSKVSPITGKPFGMKIEYFFEKEPLGNAGALYKLKDKFEDDFLLLNGDAVFDVDFNRFIKYHQEKGGLVTLFTHPNNHPYDSGLIVLNNDMQVMQWLTKEDDRPKYYHNQVNAGLHILSPKLLNVRRQTFKADLDRDILKPLAGTGNMFAYDSTEYVKDMGTPERLAEVNADFMNGKVHAKNLKNMQKAIFLDRDGTINRYIGYLKNIDEFELITGVSKAIEQINLSGYLAIVVTNQPVIARGEVTVSQLKNIHNKMETLLGNEGAYLDAIYYCPHHPDRGFKNEIKELKITCNCRKPRPGMLLEAAYEWNIDLNKSWIVGDSKNDVLAGKAAGCKTALIGDGNFGQDIEVKSLLDFVSKIIE